MIQRIVISFGISLCIGVISGYRLSYDKYFYLDDDSPKREITRAEYLNNRNIPWRREKLKVETIYNSEQAVIIGVATFGGLLVLTSLLNLMKVRAGNRV